jgi:hypothetical protein
VVVRLDRLALHPMREAAGLLTGEAERAVDGLLAGSFPEALGRSLAQHDVIERVAAELLATPDGAGQHDRLERLIEHIVHSPALERWIASGDAARLLVPLATQVMQNPEVRTTALDILESAELRHELAVRTVRANDSLFDRVRGRVRGAFDRVVAWVTRRPPASGDDASQT